MQRQKELKCNVRKISHRLYSVWNYSVFRQFEMIGNDVAIRNDKKCIKLQTFDIQSITAIVH